MGAREVATFSEREFNRFEKFEHSIISWLRSINLGMCSVFYQAWKFDKSSKIKVTLIVE